MDGMGIGAMMGALFGDTESDLRALQRAQGKRIERAYIDPDAMSDGALIIELEGGEGLTLYDAGRSCCEMRYLHTDDDLSQFAGAEFRGIEVREGGRKDGLYDVHETQFLLVHTSLGTFTVETHNEHNGYYGGFWLRVKHWTEPEDTEGVSGIDGD